MSFDLPQSPGCMFSAMAVASASSMLGRSLSMRIETRGIIEIPSFLCPALLRPTSTHRIRPLYSYGTSRSVFKPSQRRLLHSEECTKPYKDNHSPLSGITRLPQQCGGCGALSQITEAGEPGFYSLSRRSVKEYLGNAAGEKATRKLSEDKVFEASIQNLESGVLKEFQFDSPASSCKLSLISSSYHN